MANKIVYRTEDEVRDSAKIQLGFDKIEANVKQGTGQITTFNQLGFKGVIDKPDGWYLPDDCSIPAIILETKSEAEDISLQKWADEDKWVDIIRKQSGDDTVQWIKPSEHLSYQMPEKPFEIFEEDFTKTMMDYLMFKQGIDVKEFSDSLVKKVMYDSKISSKESDITIVLKGKEVHNETN